MGSVRSTSVRYCCVWKGGRILHTYNNSGGDHEIENLAALCLEMTPPYHRWYFHTMGKNTFGFLMDDGYVYFAIVYESVGNSQVLRFLEKLRDEFRTIATKRSLSGLNSLSLQEQLLPFVLYLVASLEHEWRAENDAASPYQGQQLVVPLQCNNNSNANGHMEAGSSTKAPLLGKPATKQEKKKMKNDHHVIAMREIETEEHRRSTDRGVVRIDSANNQGGTSASPLRKDFSSTRINRSNSQNLRNKWCRQVRIILAVDAAVCLVLFIVWLAICHGTQCLS